MTRLIKGHEYNISRTPGQPAIDIMNAAAFYLGGRAALIGIYLFICLLGTSAFYRICLEHRVHHPFLSASCLLVCPHFVAHVTGLGDFSVSLSLFLISLYLLNRRRYTSAPLVYAAAIGCRLSYCLFLFPLMYYIYRIEGDDNLSASRYRPALKFAAISTLVSLCFYVPLFTIYGPDLLRNLGWQSFSYHVSSSIYKLVSRGLGLPLFLLALMLMLLGWVKRPQHARPGTDNWFDTFLLMTMVVTFVIFFFVPTKVEILLPFLAALLLYLGRHSRITVTVSLLGSVIILGIVHVDLRDPSDDSLALRFANGLYMEAYAGAYENRQGGEAIKDALAGLPDRTLLITNLKTCYPTASGDCQSYAVGPSAIQGEKTTVLELIGSRARFKGMDTKYVVSFQDDGLKDFLEVNARAPESDRFQIFYDPRYRALTRRWQKVDPFTYGSAIWIRSPEIGFFPSDGLIIFRLSSFPSWLRGLPEATHKR